MAEYVVKVKQRGEQWFTVEADSAAEALRKHAEGESTPLDNQIVWSGTPTAMRSED